MSIGSFITRTSFLFFLRKKLFWPNMNYIQFLLFFFFFKFKACVKMINHVVLSKKGLDLLKCP